MFNEILLGLIQGLTEFLPVSSSGHLVLFSNWLGQADGDIFMEVLLHAGTLLATVLVFRREIGSILAGLLKWEPDAVRYTGLILTASIPTAVMGLAFKDFFESLFSNPLAVSVALIVLGGLLFSTRLVNPDKEHDRITFWQALLIGVAQGCAIVPGISRSGSTIIAALFLGVSRRRAGEFSFLISIPAVLGAVLLKAKDLLGNQAAEAAVLNGASLAGFLVAFVSGIFALKLLLHFVRRGKLYHFAWYVWLLGLFGLFMFWG